MNRQTIHTLLMGELHPRCVPKIKNGPYYDKSTGRYKVILTNGIKTALARYNMMVLLSCAKIPNDLVVHHIDEDKGNDHVDNLRLKKRGVHSSKHNIDDTRFGVSGSVDRLEYQKRYRKVTRDKQNEYKRRYYNKNKEKVLKANRDWKIKTGYKYIKKEVSVC